MSLVIRLLRRRLELTISKREEDCEVDNDVDSGPRYAYALVAQLDRASVCVTESCAGSSPA